MEMKMGRFDEISVESLHVNIIARLYFVDHEELLKDNTLQMKRPSIFSVLAWHIFALDKYLMKESMICYHIVRLCLGRQQCIK